MEPIKYVPFYHVAMPHSMVIIIEVSFSTTLAYTIVGMKFKPQTPRGTDLVNMHIEMPIKVDMILLDIH